jgi:hypothetical protein
MTICGKVSPSRAQSGFLKCYAYLAMIPDPRCETDIRWHLQRHLGHIRSMIWRRRPGRSSDRSDDAQATARAPIRAEICEDEAPCSRNVITLCALKFPAADIADA